MDLRWIEKCWVFLMQCGNTLGSDLGTTKVGDMYSLVDSQMCPVTRCCFIHVPHTSQYLCGHEYAQATMGLWVSQDSEFDRHENIVWELGDMWYISRE